MKFTKKQSEKLQKLLDEKGVYEMQKYMLYLIKRYSRRAKRGPDAPKRGKK